MTLFDFLSMKNKVNVPSKSNKQKKLCLKISFLLASWRSMTKIAGSESGSGSISQRCGLPGSISQRRGSWSTPKCHVSGTLLKTFTIYTKYKYMVWYFTLSPTQSWALAHFFKVRYPLPTQFFPLDRWRSCVHFLNFPFRSSLNQWFAERKRTKSLIALY